MSEETSVASPEDVPDEPARLAAATPPPSCRVTLIVGAVVATMAVAVAIIALTASPALRPSPDGFTQEVKLTRKANTNKRTTVTGTPPVTGLGDQATVLFLTTVTATR